MYSSAIKYIKQRIEISDKELEAALRFSIFKGYAKAFEVISKEGCHNNYCACYDLKELDRYYCITV